MAVVFFFTIISPKFKSLTSPETEKVKVAVPPEIRKNENLQPEPIMNDNFSVSWYY
jgi:hypothetical protein